MKPVKISIEAFSSFAEKQKINFSSLGQNGLYLITGETGSGKTSVFDAISFALFGKASCSNRDDYTMLRSDYADSKVKTSVKLEFISGNASYTVKRTIKKSGSGQEVELLMPNGKTESGDRNVSDLITEIIGLNREQFAQIVMIAQNDFLRFLQSKMEDRVNILRHIFETDIFNAFQEKLKARVKQEKDSHELILRFFKRYEVDVYKREEHFLECEEQIKNDKASVSEIDTQIAGNDKLKQEIAVKLANAEKLSREFKELDKLRIFLKDHEMMADEIEEDKKRADLGETALRQVKPFADEAARAVERLSSAQVSLADAKKKEAASLTELEQAKKRLEELPLLEEAKNSFAVLLKKWEVSDEQLKQLNLLQKEHDEITQKHNELEKTQNDLNTICRTLEELPSIDDSKNSFDQLSQELENNQEIFIKLSQLQKELAVINDKLNLLSKIQSEFTIFSEEFNDADKKYKALEEVFLSCQAGIFVKNLEEGKPCPVCGSENHPKPAKLSDESVTADELKKAEREKDIAHNKLMEKSKDCEKLRTEIDVLSKRFIDDLMEYIPDVTMDNANVKLLEITNKIKIKTEELTKNKDEAEKLYINNKKIFEEAVKKRDELNPKVTALKSEIDTLIKKFNENLKEYIKECDWESSKIKLAALIDQTQKETDTLTAQKNKEEKLLDDLTKQCNEANDKKIKAESSYNSAQSIVSEREKNEQEANKICIETKTKFKEMMETNNFKNESEYILALITEDELKRIRKKIDEYEKNSEHYARDIKRLEKETEGKEKPDLEKINKEAETANEESSEMGKKREEIKSRLDATEIKLKELKKAAKDFEAVEKSYAAVKQLSDTANGKLNFETYVLVEYFKRVLNAANLRLNVMSQNRYKLLRKEESDDKRSKTGLEIETFDAYTGKTRSTNSLSGGESFMVSLSLALGLSDIVQQSAGGIHLEAMFIDEGFGSLDTETLDVAIKTLSEMAGNNRIIGIISHVNELRERIDKQIRIEKTSRGSKIVMSV
ncbi:MAG: SMC family ATPase [Treponema sp.]|nr:SMC family ATPase [Treponema sp.]